MGMVSIWNIVEMTNNMVMDLELNLCLGGKFKMALNYTDNLLKYIMNDEFNDIIESIEIEFDPTDSQMFFFSTSTGLFKLDKHEESSVPVKMDTIGLNSPTAISLSDKGFLLAAYSCGSICIYDKDFTSPLTVWYHTCPYAITQIKWCKLFFDDQEMKEDTQDKMVKAPTGDQGFAANRICEFFAIDQNECF